MAYSPSVQYGYYKRLESSLIVFFFSIFLFFKVGFFFCYIGKSFWNFFSLQNSFHADFNPVEFVARMNNLVNRFYLIFLLFSSEW